jgi:hypothetical protein
MDSSYPSTGTEQPKLAPEGPLSIPSKYDVLCGRGRGFFAHPGNRRMLLVVQQYKARYTAATKTEKSRITKDVLDVIHKAGNDAAKFLKMGKDTPYWYELNSKEAHKKVAHTLREHKTIIKPSITALKKTKVHKGKAREGASKSTNATSSASCTCSNSLPNGSRDDIDPMMYLLELAADDKILNSVIAVSEDEESQATGSHRAYEDDCSYSFEETSSGDQQEDEEEVIMLPEAVFQDFDFEFLLESSLSDGEEEDLEEFLLESSLSDGEEENLEFLLEIFDPEDIEVFFSTVVS